MYLYHDGAQTLNAAITLRARCTISARHDGRLSLRSLDTNRSTEVAHWSELKDIPDFQLVGRILQFFQAESLTLTTQSDSPIGAWISGSSALNIAVCAGMARWKEVSYSPDELLAIAMNVEAQAIQVPIGAQDYRSAFYGGISAIELGASGVRRIVLDVDPIELERRIVLAYSGASRRSGVNNWDVTKRHIDGDRRIFDHFERIRDVAAAMRQALVGRDWDEVGRQIAAEWETRKRLAPTLRRPQSTISSNKHVRPAQRLPKCAAPAAAAACCVSPTPLRFLRSGRRSRPPPHASWNTGSTRQESASR